MSVFSLYVAAGDTGASHSAESPAFRDFTITKPLWLSFKLKATRSTGTQTATVKCELLWYDAAGALIAGTTTYNTIVVNATFDWQLEEFKYVPPMGAVSGTCKFTVTPTASPMQHSIWVKEVRLGKTELFATLGADWGVNLNGTPTNLAGLSGAEAIKNALLALNTTGQLTYDGTNTVSPKIVDNGQLSIGQNGALSNGNGQVTFQGLGGKALGQLDTLGWSDAKFTGRPANLSSLTGTEALKNALFTVNGVGQLTYDGSNTVSAKKLDNGLISIGNNGALINGGGGQVTLSGIGHRGYSLGGSLLPDSTFEPNSWGIFGTASRQARAASNGFAIGGADYCLEVTPGTAVQGADSIYFPVEGNQTYTARVKIQSNSTATGTVNAVVYFYTETGGYLGSGTLGSKGLADVPAGAAPKEFAWSFNTPATAKRAYMRVETEANASPAGAWRFETPLLQPFEVGATVGATWGSNLAGRPGNLSALSGNEALKNALFSITAAGLLTYDGTNNVSTKVVDNGQLSIGQNGALSNGNGQVTFQGLGGKALGQLDTLDWGDAKFTGRPSNLAALAGSEAIRNADIIAGGVNLCSDPSFENGLPHITNRGDGGNVVLALGTTSALDGSNYLAPGMIGSHYFTIDTAQFVATETSATISIYARDAGVTNQSRTNWAGGTPANQCSVLHLGLYDVAGAVWDAGSGNVANTIPYVGAVGAWARYTATITGLTPGRTYAVQIMIDPYHGGEAIDLDCLQVEEGNQASAFSKVQASRVVTAVPQSNPTALVINGNQIRKVSGSGWDTSAYCLEPMNGTAVVQFQGNVANGAIWMAGLTHNPTANIASITDVQTNGDFLFYKNAAGSISTYIGGYALNLLTGQKDTAVFTIIYDGTKVYLYVNGTLINSASTTSGRTLYFVFYPGSTGSYVNKIRVGHFSAPNWSGNVQGRPSNLAALAGSEQINNASLSIGNNGALSNGNGQVTIGGLTPNGMDDLADGPTYKRYAATEQAKLAGVEANATHGADLATNVTNIVPKYLPATTAAGGQYVFTGAISYTSTTSSATISVAAGTLYAGSAISYNAMTATVSGSGTVKYFLYVNANCFVDGDHTLLTSTTSVNTVNNPNIVLIGTVDVTYTTSGGGTGTGGGGGGVLGCVTADTIIPGIGTAADVKLGMEMQLANPHTFKRRTGVVTKADHKVAYCLRITTESGIQLDCSRDAMIANHHGGLVFATELRGMLVPVNDNGETRYERVISVEKIGLKPIVHITCENDLFLAGKEEGRYLLHHNVKP